MRSEWIPKGEIEHILASLNSANRLVCEVSLATGLRVSDVLALKTEQVRKERFTVREQKTGKCRTVRLPKALRERCLLCCGTVYVFQGRLNGRKPRTRQAVFKDLRRARERFNIKANLSLHSLRKAYAVEEYRRSGCDLQRVRKLLNHDSEAVTMLYAMADELTRRKKFKA